MTASAEVVVAPQGPVRAVTAPEASVGAVAPPDESEWGPPMGGLPKGWRESPLRDPIALNIRMRPEGTSPRLMQDAEKKPPKLAYETLQAAFEAIISPDGWGGKLWGVLERWGLVRKDITREELDDDVVLLGMQGDAVMGYALRDRSERLEILGELDFPQNLDTGEKAKDDVLAGFRSVTEPQKAESTSTDNPLPRTSENTVPSPSKTEPRRAKTLPTSSGPKM